MDDPIHHLYHHTLQKQLSHRNEGKSYTKRRTAIDSKSFILRIRFLKLWPVQATPSWIEMCTQWTTSSLFQLLWGRGSSLVYLCKYNFYLDVVLMQRRLQRELVALFHQTLKRLFYIYSSIMYLYNKVAHI